jgi:hypothetical protein
MHPALVDADFGRAFDRRLLFRCRSRPILFETPEIIHLAGVLPPVIGGTDTAPVVVEIWLSLFAG